MSERLPNMAPMPSGAALAQQLSAQLAMAATQPRRSMSRSAPTSPATRPRRDLAPLSTIQAIDIGTAQSHTAAFGAGHGGGLAPAAQISPEVRAQVRMSPEMQIRALRHSPEVVLKALSPLTMPSQLPQVQQHQQRSYPVGSVPVTSMGQMPPMPQRGVTIPQPNSPVRVNRRPRSRSRSRSRVSSGSEASETEVDSDSTFVPGRVRHHQHSRSQPDLSALRSRVNVEGWADGVMRTQLEERRAANNSHLTRRRSQGRKTPPHRPIPLAASTSVSPFSTGNGGPSGPRHSPRASTVSIPHLTQIRTDSSPMSSSEDSSREGSRDSPFSIRSPLGGMTGSEDADDDLESLDSPSSGSLSFSPKARTRNIVRQRSLPSDKLNSRALGLLLEPTNSGDEVPRRSVDLKAAIVEARLRRSSLRGYRLLAIVPALWGIAVLFHAFVTGALWYDVWPWGVDFSREALESLVAGHNPYEGIKRPVHRGDMLLAIAWVSSNIHTVSQPPKTWFTDKFQAWLTAQFCFGLTTGLTYRWRSYYSLPSTVTRLLSLQCLCWPATYITLWFLGPRRPLLSWVVIGVTTGCSRCIQMWVTSNVISDEDEDDAGGDITPGPFRRGSPQAGPKPTPRHVKGWRVFTYNRHWNWDRIAYKVGWKVCALLLITCAWLLYRLDELEDGWTPAVPPSGVALA